MKIDFVNSLISFWTISNYLKPTTVQPTVELALGKIQGENRGHFDAFEGIPYAKPPVGPLRFAPPQPITDSWTNVVDRTTVGARCLQWDHFVDGVDKIKGEEDCLFLNVYVPHNRSATELLPVLFFIHGGALTFGHADFYGPDYIMWRPMILVTFNYRVGPLGFLSTGDEVVPGNMGLKDQTVALRWINDHATAFGGDSRQITMVGFSAGAGSVHLHYMSKGSRGLFARGISHSGCALNPWMMAERSREKAQHIGTRLHCPINGSTELITCLREKPAVDIVRRVADFLPYHFFPFSPFGTVVEPVSEHAFLTNAPHDHLVRGDIAPLPWLVSAVQDEGVYNAAELLRDSSYLSELNESWDTMLPAILDYNGTVENEDKIEVAQRIKHNYLGGEPVSLDNFQEFTKIVTDRIYLFGIEKAIQLQATANRAPVFCYFYRMRASMGIGQILSHMNHDDKIGVAHGDDVLLVYKNIIRSMIHWYTNDESQMQQNILDMYESFSKNGKPLFGSTPIEAIKPNEEQLNILDVVGVNSIQMKVFKDLSNKDFWEALPIHENGN